LLLLNNIIIIILICGNLSREMRYCGWCHWQVWIIHFVWTSLSHICFGFRSNRECWRRWTNLVAEWTRRCRRDCWDLMLSSCSIPTNTTLQVWYYDHRYNMSRMRNIFSSLFARSGSTAWSENEIATTKQNRKKTHNDTLRTSSNEL